MSNDRFYRAKGNGNVSKSFFLSLNSKIKNNSQKIFKNFAQVRDKSDDLENLADQFAKFAVKSSSEEQKSYQHDHDREVQIHDGESGFSKDEKDQNHNHDQFRHQFRNSNRYIRPIFTALNSLFQRSPWSRKQRPARRKRSSSKQSYSTK